MVCSEAMMWPCGSLVSTLHGGAPFTFARSPLAASRFFVRSSIFPSRLVEVSCASASDDATELSSFCLDSSSSSAWQRKTGRHQRHDWTFVVHAHVVATLR